MDLNPLNNNAHSPGHNPDLLPQSSIDALAIRHRHLQTLQSYSLESPCKAYLVKSASPDHPSPSLGCVSVLSHG